MYTLIHKFKLSLFLLFILILHLFIDLVYTYLNTGNINIKRHHSFYLLWIHLMVIPHASPVKTKHMKDAYLFAFLLYISYTSVSLITVYA